MSLKEFFNKFGVETSTNLDLIHWAKLLKIKEFRYVMRDEMGLLPKKYSKDLYVMTNIHTSQQNGVHHNAFCITKKGSYFFDSYGLSPTQEVIDYIHNIKTFSKSPMYTTFKIQQDNTRYCGQISLYFLYLMKHSDLSFFDIVLRIKQEIQNL
jgi:hypothetical protein